MSVGSHTVIVASNAPRAKPVPAISQHYWARISCYCRNVSVHPAFSPESSVTPPGSGLEEAFEMPSPQAPKRRKRRRVRRAWAIPSRPCSRSAHRHCLHPSAIPSPNTTTVKRGRDDEPMKTKCGQAYDRRCIVGRQRSCPSARGALTPPLEIC